MFNFLTIWRRIHDHDTSGMIEHSEFNYQKENS